MSRGDSSTFKLPKITVTCVTCGTTDSFYSTLSLNQFKAKHAGHKIVDGEERPVVAVAAASAPERIRASPAPPAARVDRLPSKSEGTRVPRLLVDLVNFPALSKSVFRIRGFNGGPEPSFTVTIHDGEERRVKELLSRGQYVDFGFSDLLYVWEPSAIEYDEACKAKLGIMETTTAEDAGPGEWRSAPPPRESPPEEADTSVAKTIESMLAASKKEAAEGPRLVLPMDEEIPRRPDPPAKEQPMQPPIAVPPVVAPPPEPVIAPDVRSQKPSEPPSEPSYRPIQREGNGQGHEEPLPNRPLPAPDPRPTPEVAQKPILLPAPPRPTIETTPTTPKPAPAVEPPKEVKIVPKPVAIKAPAPKALLEPRPAPREEGEENQLLVSKSWYVQGGEKNTKEAIRISKLLKAFRWKIEPVYTIGVILDDMLNIETAKNQISRTLIKKVEDAGYRLTAVALEQGKLVAWFKRNPAPTEGHGPRARTSERIEIDEPGTFSEELEEGDKADL